MNCLLCCWMAQALAVFLVAEVGTEQTNTVPSNLTVIDEAATSHVVTPADFSKLPRRVVKTSAHGQDAEFSGTSLVDLLKSCGVVFGHELRGVRTPTIAILEATDGYRIVITLLEIDPDTTDNIAIVADKRDGKPLGNREGPYRLVLRGDKRPIRWIRNLQTIRVINLKELPLGQPASREPQKH